MEASGPMKELNDTTEHGTANVLRRRRRSLIIFYAFHDNVRLSCVCLLKQQTFVYLF